MIPYNLSCTQRGTYLYQLKDGRFQLIQEGAIAPFMWGPGYVLVENAMAEFLEALRLCRVSCREAVIWDRKNDKEYRSHKQLIIGHHFSADQIDDLDLDGERMFLMGDQHVFVSPALKQKLESESFSYLRFSERLSDFFGRET
jgi:hypothetical protein